MRKLIVLFLFLASLSFAGQCNLPPVQFASNVPGWLQVTLPNMQATEDRRYCGAVDIWIAGAQDWLANAKLLREQAKDPATFVPVPYTRQLPVREVYVGHPDGSFDSVTWVDPNLKAPELPAFVSPTAPSTAIVTGAPTKDAQQDAFNAAIMKMLFEIKASIASGCK